jgi:CDP-glucose 4,6-dehydratase
MITSDKAYDNVEWVWGYRESDPLGGKDPYSASKGMAELAIKTYLHSFFTSPERGVRIGITRAGNVIGGGDWARNRIVPDCVDAWSKNKIVDIRRPDATRPWQHVLEPLSGYLSLGSELYESPGRHGEAYNFGPPANQNYPVRDLINEMGLSWKNVRWNDKSDDLSNFHEAGLLKLNCDKALFDLNWLPTLEFSEAVKMTIDWYKTYYENEKKSMWEFSSKQIDDFTKLAEIKRRSWAIY